MNINPPWAIPVRILVYPIMFSDNPLDLVECVLDSLIDESTVQRDWKQHLTSLRAALESDSSLSELLPQDHSEEVIRAYLSKAVESLAARLSH